MIHLQQTREEVFQNTFKLQERIKKINDRKEKADKFHRRHSAEMGREK